MERLKFTKSQENPYELWKDIEKEIDNVVLQYNESGKPLAPNGIESKLPEILAKATRTQVFLNWFGNWINDPDSSSKVVFSDTKEPMPFFHGTNEFRDDLHKPLKPAQSDESHLNGYIYFTRNSEYAQFLGIMFTAFLNIKKPNTNPKDLYVDWYPENKETKNQISLRERNANSDGFLIHMDRKPNEESTGHFTAVVKDSNQVLQIPFSPIFIEGDRATLP